MNICSSMRAYLSDIKSLVQAQSPSLNKEATDSVEKFCKDLAERLGVEAQVCQQLTLGNHLLLHR